MKLDESQGFMSEGEVINTKQFDIGNKQIIFSILRSKMYPNPIKAFTQEIMSNARDANREVGKNDTPIEVQLPNRFDPCFHVRDFGPGISPDRMENIFIKYGNSTKRDTNDQTGGFGLGAKSPWAYTDSFCITTYIPDDNGNMIQRAYVAVIGPDKIGELKFISEEVVENERQGTKITIACKPGDENTFRDWIRVATQYWDNKEVKDSVRPIIYGDNFTWTDEATLFEGTRWFCRAKDAHSYTRSDPMAVIDGIPYKLNWSNLNLNDYDSDTRAVFDKLSYYPVCMFFDTGELPLAANREEIEYTPDAVKLIHNRLGELIEELVTIATDSIKNAKDLFEANLMFNKIRNNFAGVVNSVEWQGTKVTGSGPNIQGSGVHFVHFSRHYKTDGTFRKSNRFFHNTFMIEDDNLVIFNDEDSKHPNRRRLNTIFSNNNIKAVTVIQFPEDAQRKIDAKKKLDDMKIGLWGLGNISDYEKTAIVRNTSGVSSGNTTANGYSVPRIWKFDGYGSNRSSWTTDGIDDQKDLIENGEGIYVLLFRREASLVTTGKVLSNYDLDAIANKFGNKKVYGISKKTIDKVGKGWIKLEDVVLDEIKELENDPELDDFVNAVGGVSNLCQSQFCEIWRAFKSEYKKFSDGKLKEYFDLSVKYDENKIKMEKVGDLKRFYKSHIDSKYEIDKTQNKSNKPGINFNAILLDVKNLYPMITGYIRIDTYSPQITAIRKDFIDYVKMCDNRRRRPEDSGWEDDDEEEEKAA